MRVLVVTHPTPKDIKNTFKIEDSDYIIAVDQAVLALYKQRIKINLAVGDFDSLSNHGILNTLNVVRLNPVKDITDTHQALIEAKKINPDEIYLIGGMGGNRIEHFIVHMMFFNEFNDLKIVDENTKIYMLEKGVHEIKENEFISFFAYPRANISVTGFKYDLTNYLLTQYDPLCISNELVNGKGYVHVLEGRVLVVISKKQ
jgi:thiamine pyrophosphokinase